MYDDSGNLESYHTDDYMIVGTDTRARHLSEKYDDMVNMLEKANQNYDVLAVWDDDDLYLPNYLENMSKTLQNHRWCKPSIAGIVQANKFSLVPTRGSFHATLGISKEIYIESGGWGYFPKASFDLDL